MKREVKEAIGDLGHEEVPESPIAKLGQTQPEPEELEPEDAEFDARDYVANGINLGAYLEPMGFTQRTNVRDGVTAYSLKHVPLPAPVRFVDDEDEVHEVAWANIHVRYDSAAAIPFWRVLVSPGHDVYYYTDLQMAKIVRVPELAEADWVPDAVAAAKEAVNIVQQPLRGHLAFLTYRLKQAGFKPF